MKVLRYMMPVVVLAGAALVALFFYSARPAPKKKAAAGAIVPVVSVAELVKRDLPVTIEAFGNVVPAREVKLAAEVEGRIIAQHPGLVPGGIIPAGEAVVEIDPRDYDLKVKAAQAEVDIARHEIEIEEGRQVIARQEWRLMENDPGQAGAANPSLARREPQIKLARARLAAAQSRLAAARLARDRTVLKAPFTAMVLDEKVDVGQVIGRQAPMATLIGADTFWVQVAVPLERLARIRFADAGGRGGSTAHIWVADGRGSGKGKEGRVLRVMGDLDPRGRLARVLVAIDDPLDLSSGRGGLLSGQKRILIGSYVRVEIDAGMVGGVYVIPRDALRDGDRVWLLNVESRLEVVPVELVWRRHDDVLARFVAPEGARLITSRLPVPLPGMRLAVPGSVRGVGEK